jgi:hypothetical protein
MISCIISSTLDVAGTLMPCIPLPAGTTRHDLLAQGRSIAPYVMHCAYALSPIIARRVPAHAPPRRAGPRRLRQEEDKKPCVPVDDPDIRAYTPTT